MKAILFDMDGVLVDVSASYRQAVKLTAEFFLGSPVSPETIQEYKNRGGFNNDWDLTAAIIDAHIDSHAVAIERQRVIDCFQRLYLGENYDGLISRERCLIKKETLAVLAAQYKLGIVTGRPGDEALYALKRFEIEGFFPVIIAMEDVPPGKGKPDPLGIRLALEQLQANGGCYIGDTVDDIKAAIDADIVPIGIPAPGSDTGEQTRLLKQAGAETVLNNINECINIFSHGRTRTNTDKHGGFYADKKLNVSVGQCSSVSVRGKKNSKTNMQKETLL